MNGKEFLEDFDPQIKEVGYDNYSYTPNQVIQRLDAFKKQLLLHNVGSSLPKIKEILYSQKEIDYIEKIADDYNMQEETVLEILKTGFRMYKKRLRKR